MLLVYFDNVHILDENTNAIKMNRHVLSDVCKEVRLELVNVCSCQYFKSS
jgi:hypothetical protein